MDLFGYLRAARKNWWIVVTALVLGVGAAVGVNLLTTPKYESTIKFIVSVKSSDGNAITQASAGEPLALTRLATYHQLITTNSVAQAVANDVKNGLTPGQISASISAATDTTTPFLNTTVTYNNADTSRTIAESLEKVFPEIIANREASVPEGGAATAGVVSLDVVDSAKLDTSPVEPRTKRNIAVGLLAGLLLGLALAILREVLDKSVRAPEELENAAGAPVLGLLPNNPDAAKAPLITGGRGQSATVEAFRKLRTNVRFADSAHPLSVVVVTSALPDEGKSLTAANLAISFARKEANVLLVEGDLRRPKIADYFGLEGSVGLTNVLVGEVALSEVLQPAGAGLTVLAGGSIPANPAELLDSLAMGELMQTLRASYDLVIFDSPAVLPVTDAVILAAASDGVLLVTKYGKTTKAQVSAAVKSLSAVGARLLGTVLTMVPGK